MKNFRTILYVLLALVLTLGLGTAATATGLTNHTVKRIAAKVVNQKAASLHVEYADTAGDAKTLDGMTKGQLVSRGFVFAIPTQAPSSTTRAYKFLDLPDGPYGGYGNYLVTYNISATMSDPGATLSCSVDPNLADPNGAFGHGQTSGGISVVNASGVMLVVRANAILTCTPSSGTFTIDSPSTISFLPLNSITTYTAGLP